MAGGNWKARDTKGDRDTEGWKRKTMRWMRCHNGYQISYC